MRKQDYIIQLIKSLDPSERRYFKLYSGLQSGEKKYLQLFDLLEEADEYDPNELSDKLKVTTNQLAVLKRYLNDAILSSLRNLNEQTTQIAALYIAKEDARILLSRRLFLQALDIAEKTFLKAKQLDQFEVALELLNIRHISLFNMQRYEEAAAVCEEYKELAGLEEEVLAMQRLKSLATDYEIHRNKSNEFKQFCEEPLIKGGPDKLNCLRSKSAWFDIMFRYELSAGSMLQVLDITRKEWDCYLANPIIKISNGSAYASAFLRLAYNEHFAGNSERALEITDQLKLALNEGSVDLSNARRLTFMASNESFRMYVLLRLERFEEVLKESPEVIKLMRSRPLAEQFANAFNYALALVYSNEHDLAVNELNKLLEINEEVRLDLQRLVRLLLVMVHLDCGNSSLIPYQVKSAKSWMKRHKCEDETVDGLYKHFLAVSKLSQRERRKKYQEMLAEIDEGKFQPLADLMMLPYWLRRRTAPTN
jgi:tetratricopeptide (TPR) repeat protein